MRNAYLVGASLLTLGLSYTGLIQAEEAVVKVKDGGLRVSFGEAAFRIGGRAQFDAAWVDDDITEIPSGTDVRRARLFIKGSIDKDWSYKFQYDFSEHVMKDMFFTYKGMGFGNITIGQFAPAMFLESYTSSKWTTMIERAVVDNFALDRELGIQFDHSGDNYSLYASITGDNMEDDETGDDAYSLVGRFTFAPMHSEGKVLHLGTTLGFLEAPNDGISFGARPGSKVDGGGKLVNNGVAEAEKQFVRGVEFAAVMGSFSVQSEYIMALISAKDGSEDEDYAAYYLAATWFLTGESRSYYVDGGIFDQPIMTRNAWEIAARYDHVDLSDDSNGIDDKEGKLDTITLGLNFYPTKSIRFSLNLITSESDLEDDTEEDVKIVQFRSQLVF